MRVSTLSNYDSCAFLMSIDSLNQLRIEAFDNSQKSPITFLVLAPHLVNRNGKGEGIIKCSLGEHDEMSKGTCMYDSLKNHKNNSKILEKIFWKKKFSTKKFRKKYLFFAILTKNSINLVSMQSSIHVGKSSIVQNDRNTILTILMNTSLKLDSV